MTWAQETKNLVADIKTSHRDRTKYLGDLKGDTHELIARFRGELKEMARDLKAFLAKSEADRKKDFDATMRTIAARIKDIKARVKDLKGESADLIARFDRELKEMATDLKAFLKKSETTRMADFRGMMKDITADIDSIRKTVGTMLTDYRAERKEAAGYWARLRAREEAAPAAPAAPGAPKRRRRRRRRKKK